MNKNKTSLIDAFNIERKSPKIESDTDYEIFADKKLLDDLRTKIVENLIDKEIPKDKVLNEFINEEIDAAIEGYDLSNLERNQWLWTYHWTLNRQKYHWNYGQ